MPLVTALPEGAPSKAVEFVAVPVDRHTLSHRRWRMPASDGTDFAVDLETPCTHGALLWADDLRAYRVEQAPEPVIEVAIPDNKEEAARLGWFFGNQHLPIEVGAHGIRLQSNEQLADLLERKGIAFERTEGVFAPPAHSSGHSHGHSH